MLYSNNKIYTAIMVALGMFPSISRAIDFNMDMLKGDKGNVNLLQFTKEGYVAPGDYTLTVFINNRKVKEYSILYLKNSKGEEVSPCLPLDVLRYFLLKPSESRKITSINVFNKSQTIQCIDNKSIRNLNIKVNSDINLARLDIKIPEIYQRQLYDNWVEPELWDDGINALIFDYKLMLDYRKYNDGVRNKTISTYGDAGVNLGAWRLRLNYDANIDNSSSYNNKDINVRDIHAFTPIRGLSSVFSVGEVTNQSLMFDSYRFLGVSLRDDERMLPPQLRGYAPTIHGIARTNAKVTVSYLGSIIYQTTVPPGPFTINDLNSGLQGVVRVTIREEDGSERNFEQNLESTPYLSREDSIRYNISAGKPLRNTHTTANINLLSGDVSYGITSNTSIIGGSIISNNYQAYSSGVAQGLGVLGAVSGDITHSSAKFDNGKQYSGNSYNLSYTKDISLTHSSLTFSNYRYSSKGYLGIAQYIDMYDAYNNDFHETKYYDLSDVFRVNKSLFLANFSQQFFPDTPSLGFNASLSYSLQSYWNNQSNAKRIGVLLSKNWIMHSTPVYTSMNFSETKNSHSSDKMLSFYVSIPFGNNNIGYSISENKGHIEQSSDFYKQLDDGSNVSTSVYSNKNTTGIRGMYSSEYRYANIDAFGSVDSRQASGSLSLSGGLLTTQYGVVLHPQINSDSRILVDTNGVPNIPFESTKTKTNSLGLAVLDGNAYFSKEARVDFNNINDNIEVFDSIKDITLTEGAVGYLKFESLAGDKRLVVIELANNKYPPYAAEVFNSHGRRVGMVGKDGLTYLAGLNANEVFNVKWGDNGGCKIRIPDLGMKKSTLTIKCQGY